MAKESTADAGKFTFYFVGSFDEATIKGYIEQYIASLPATGKKSNYKNVSSTPKGEVLNHFKRKMETPKAMSRMYWSNTTLPYTLENSIKASIAGQLALMANVDEMDESRIYVKLRKSPTPNERPIPPFFFSQERLTPISVRMNARPTRH